MPVVLKCLVAPPQALLHKYKNHKFLLSEIRRMVAFSKQKLPISPWGNGGPFQNAWPWEKDFCGDQTRHYNLRTIFIPPGAQGSMSTELFLNCIPLRLSLTMWASSTHPLPKGKVLRSCSSLLNHAIVISLCLVAELWPFMASGWGTVL